MARDKREPKQHTPKGTEIRVPKRREFDDLLKKVAPPVSRKRPGGKGRPRRRSEPRGRGGPDRRSLRAVPCLPARAASPRFVVPGLLRLRSSVSRLDQERFEHRPLVLEAMAVAPRKLVAIGLEPPARHGVV